METTVRCIDRRGVGSIGGALYRSADRSKHRRSFGWIGEASYRSAERCADRRPVVRIGGLSYRSAGRDKDRWLARCIRDPSYGLAECWIGIRIVDRSARRFIDRRGIVSIGGALKTPRRWPSLFPPGERGARRSMRQVPPLQGGWGRGAVNLALKHQAIQMPPFQGEAIESWPSRVKRGKTRGLAGAPFTAPARSAAPGPGGRG